MKFFFVSFERTEIIQININSFYHKSVSYLAKDTVKSMCRVRLQLLLPNGIQNI